MVLHCLHSPSLVFRFLLRAADNNVAPISSPLELLLIVAGLLVCSLDADGQSPDTGAGLVSCSLLLSCFILVVKDFKTVCNADATSGPPLYTVHTSHEDGVSSGSIFTIISISIWVSPSLPSLSTRILRDEC